MSLHRRRLHRGNRATGENITLIMGLR